MLVSREAEINAQKQEGEKNRALQMAEMYIRRDESQLDRLHQQNMALKGEYFRAQREAANVVGSLEALDSLSKEDKSIGNDARSIVGQRLEGFADKKAMLEESIIDNERKILDLNNYIGEYRQGTFGAKETFEDTRTLEKPKSIREQATVNRNEFNIMVERENILRESQDKPPLTEADKRGRWDEYVALGEKAFGQLMEEAKFNALLDQMKAEGLANRNKMDKLASDMQQKQLMDQYRQEGEGWKRVANDVLEIDPKDQITMVTPDASAKTLKGSQDHLARSFADKIIKYKDEPIFAPNMSPPALTALMDSYKNATGEKKDAYAKQLMRYFSNDPDGYGYKLSNELDTETWGLDDKDDNIIKYLMGAAKLYKIGEQFERFNAPAEFPPGYYPDYTMASGSGGVKETGMVGATKDVIINTVASKGLPPDYPNKVFDTSESLGMMAWNYLTKDVSSAGTKSGLPATSVLPSAMDYLKSKKQKIDVINVLDILNLGAEEEGWSVLGRKKKAKKEK